MKHQDDIKPIGLLFSVLRQAPERDSARAAAGKAAFVGQAVSLQADKRHKGWNAVVLTRKEPHKMSAMATIALVVALVFGGAGVTGVAAQGALPDQPLYRVKVLTEDMRYNLASDTAARWQLMLAFCDQRAYEIRTLAQNGAAPDDAVLARYQQQVERALQLTLQLADDQAAPALEQMRTRLQAQEQTLADVPVQTGTAQTVAALARARTMLRSQLELLETGAGDPQKLRDMLQQRDQERDCVDDDCEPAQQRDRDRISAPSAQPTTQAMETRQFRNGQAETATPGGDCGGCTPTGESQNPWTDDTPTPGSGYGPGPGPEATVTCTPQAGNEPGLSPTVQPSAGPQPTAPHEPSAEPTGQPQGPQATMVPQSGGAAPTANPRGGNDN